MIDTSNPLSTEHAVRAWLGIPFATAERFRKPTLLPFNPDLPYDQKGAAPLQAGDTAWLEADNGVSEDCLNLNIWAPDDADGETLPVVVYVFGGGWMLGSNTQTTSNVAGLAATGRVIGVAINYRLGAFGALSLSQYGGALSEASNLALQDIITALQWVKQNISRFGGNPDNVTVTGHSAGAFSTLALLAAPTADGLFHHIAAFSGMPSRQVPAWGAEERAHAVLTTLGIQDDPDRLVDIDAHLLADTTAGTQSADPGSAHGIDSDVIAIVDDRNQPGGILTDHPMHVLESGRHADVDILFSSTTGETDWWVNHRSEDFDPGTIDNLVDEFSHRNRIPRSRARQLIEAFNTTERTPIQVRSALLTNYSFTLPQVRGALAHAAAGGRAYLLAIAPVAEAEAVHGTEMYGIVGQKRPGASDEVTARDLVVRDALLALATGKTDELWTPVTTVPTTNGIGDMPYDATAHAEDMLAIFDGIERP